MKPPASAAAVPVAIVSSSSRPGSRRWTCMSIRPGRDDLARGVDDRILPVRRHVVGGDAPVADQQIRDPIHLLARIDHPAAFDQDVGMTNASAIARDLARIRFDACVPSSAIRRCTSHSTAIRTARPLVTCSRISRVRAVGHVGRELDAAVDRAGGQEQDVGLGSGQPLAVHRVEQRIFADRGERPRRLPLELDPQQVEHVAPRQDLVEASRRPRRPALPSAARRASTGRRRSRAPRASSGPRCSTGRCGYGRCRRPGRRSAPRSARGAGGSTGCRAAPASDARAAPSPALITEQSQILGQQVRRAGRADAARPRRRPPSPRCSWPCR